MKDKRKGKTFLAELTTELMVIVAITAFVLGVGAFLVVLGTLVEQTNGLSLETVRGGLTLTSYNH